MMEQSGRFIILHHCNLSVKTGKRLTPYHNVRALKVKDDIVSCSSDIDIIFIYCTALSDAKLAHVQDPGP